MSKFVKLQEPAQVASAGPNLDIGAGTKRDIFEELEIPHRTQRPPSADLVARLNEIASKPPFSYIHKIKEHETR